MFFENVPFQTWCFIISALLLVPGVALLAAPTLSSRLLLAFPRSRVAGILLSTAALFWGVGILYFFPLDFLMNVRKYLPFIFLAAAPLSWWFLKDLLACRSFGGLLVLLPAPVLLAARFQETAWRLVIVVLMYVFAVVGMFVILYPYLLRDWIKRLTSDRVLLKVFASSLVFLGAAVAVIGACSSAGLI